MKDSNQEQKKGSNANANEAVQKKSNAKSLPAKGSLQLKGDDEQQETETLSSQKSAVNGKLPADVQMKMESSFGQDFSSVNIHANSGKASSLGALAYTQGQDIHFASGKYEPGSKKGQELIGHELTHVVQQQQGRVQATTSQKGVNINDDIGLETEADMLGNKAASHNYTGATNTVQAKMSNHSNAPVQMMSEEDKKKVNKVKPGAFDKFVNFMKGKAEQAEPAVELGKTGAGLFESGSDFGKGVNGEGLDSFATKQKEAAGSTMGMGKGSSGVLGSITATGGLAAGVAGGGAQAYGAYTDQQAGKYSKEKGGKGWGGVATAAGRGLSTAADVTTSALKTTQAISAVTGNAGAFSAAAAGLAPMGMITSGFQGVKGVHNAMLNKGREAKAEDMAAKATDPEQKKLFESLAENKKEKKHKGMADAALGAGGMVAAGLMLNPVTAPAGLAIGAALGLGQGAYSLFKMIRQKGRDKADEYDKKSAMTPAQIIDTKTKEYEATIAEGKDTWNPWKKHQAKKAEAKLTTMNADKDKFAAGKSNEYKQKSNRYNNIFDKTESTASQKEKKDKMAEQIQGLSPETQQEAMHGIMGINKFEKDEQGGLAKDAKGKPKKTAYFQNQIFTIQEAFVKKQDPQAVAAKAEDIAATRGAAKKQAAIDAGQEPEKEPTVFSSEKEITALVAEAMGMSEDAAEKQLLSSKL
ncbi:MAG: hypothetical protein K0S33_1754 [Bacteroidetes bacterium]|nr:hypothetical protein [Bacteroidota bacterium]